MKARALAVAVQLLLSAACARTETATDEAEPAAGPLEVRAVVAGRADITSWVDASGDVFAARVLRLASPVAGRITDLGAMPGDSLGAGEVAARVLPVESDAAVNGFRALSDTGSLDAAERRRSEQLAADLGRRAVALRVPFPALVAERLHNPGELVAANDVLLELFDPLSLDVRAQLPSGTAVAPGMPAEVETGGGEKIGGRVVALEGAVAPQALTLPARIALDRPLPRLLLHAPVRCRIAVATHPHVLVVPRIALLPARGEGDAAVMVAVGEHAHERAVRTGIRDGDLVEITAGLAEGDVVLVEGQYGIPDGARVDARTAPRD